MIKVREILDRRIICEDLMVGEVKEIMFDPDEWKITHFEVKLSKEAAELALGTRKGGIVNLLAVSAVGDIGQTINLKVKKGQLRIYLSPKLQQ